MRLRGKFRKIAACTMIMSLLLADSVYALELNAYSDDGESVTDVFEGEILEEGYVPEEGTYQDEVLEIPVNEEASDVTDIMDTVSMDVVMESADAGDDPVVYAEMFPGLDNSYVFGAEEAKDKEEVRDNIESSDNLTEGIDYVKGEILVSADSRDEAEKYAKAFNGKLESFEYNLAVISLNEDRSLPEASVMDAVIASSDKESMLPAAWPNYYRDLYENDILDMETAVNEGISLENGFEAAEGAAESVSDPMLNPSYNMYQWHHSLIGSKQAWNAGYNGKNVKVCVIDTGINTSHEDVVAKVKSGCPANGDDPEDKNGHGSNVAGVIAAIGDNNKGGKGIAYGSELYVINVNYYDSSTGSYKLSDEGIIKAVNKASENYMVDVINMSLGGPAYSGELNSAVKNAYGNGIAVICAAGNNDTSAISYPAGCDGAISVAAVDMNNSRAFFSNYGGIDFSAPGVNIYSVYKGGSNKYAGMSGTSQATPCISGIAAVLLSTGRVEGSGSRKVENLKKLMASGCTSSGLGKGTPDLGKILGLGTIDSAPGKPTIMGDKQPGTYEEASITVSFNKILGTKIYYTTDGTNVSYKNGAASKGAEEYIDGIVLTGKSKITLKAIAVNETNRMVSPVATYTYYLKPKASAVIPKAGNGVNAVAKGGKLQMTAEIKPENTANKKVEWSLEGSPSGVTITSSGLLKVSNDTSAASCVVVARALDGSNKTGSVNVSILGDAVTVKSIKPAKKSFTLYSGTKSETVEVKVTKKDNTAVSAATVIRAVSEDVQVAEATLTGDTLSIKPVAVGKTRILLTAGDGSGVSAAINVVVKQSVTDFEIEGLTGNKLAKGKGFKPVVTFVPEDAALKKLDWKLTAVPSGSSAADCGVKVNASSGAVSTKAGAVDGPYTITATAKDGSGVSKTYSFEIINDRITKIGVETAKARIFRLVNAYGSSPEATISFTATGLTSDNRNSISVTSSNPDMAEITAKTINSDGTGSFTVRATGNAAGTVTVTVASADGTNIKKKIKVSVVNPPSAVRLSAPKNRAQSLAKGKSMKLVASVETAYGKVDSASRKFTFTSNHPEWVSVNEKTGTVTSVVSASTYDSSKQSYTPAEITATAADGSKVSGKCSITPCALIRKITYGGQKAGWLPKGSGAQLYGYVSTEESGAISGRFKVTVNKKGLGINPISDVKNGVYGVVVVGNAKGTYKVSVKPTDGSSAGISWTVLVK